jgi:hypothetical protein
VVDNDVVVDQLLGETQHSGPAAEQSPHLHAFVAGKEALLDAKVDEPE